MWEQLIRDARYTSRMLWRSPGFTLTAVLCLGLGIGASTTIFSVVNAVLFRPLPYQDSDRLVRVYSEFPTFPGGGLPKFAMSPVEFREAQQQGRAWDQIEAYVTGGANLAGGSEPIRVNAAFITGGMFRLLGVSPALGRAIEPADDREGAPITVMLSNALWERAFAGDRSVIGREVYVDGGKATVIGVMPKGFEFPPGLNEAIEVWTPVQLTAQNFTRRSNHFLSVVAHLKPGLSLPAARSELNSMVAEFGKRQAPNFHTLNPQAHTATMFSFHEEVIGNVRTAMLVLLGAVAFFLLIACVNVANLLLARSDSRQREIAVRTAVGAGSMQLLRQFVVEGLILSSLGAILGVALATAGVNGIIATNAGLIPRIREAGIDSQVLLYCVAVAIVTGIVFGLTPAFHILARSLNESLRAAAGRSFGSIRANRFRGALVSAELSLALILLIGAGLLVQAFWKLQRVDSGVRPDHVVTMRVALSNASYRDQKNAVQFWNTLSARLAELPGVEFAGIMSGLPPVRNANQNDTEIEGFVPRPNGPIQNLAYYQTVGGQLFEALGVRLVDGRFFDARDAAAGQSSVIVNQTTARTFWPGESAVGKRLRPMGNKDWLTIVGVVADVRNAGLDKPVGTEAFFPAAQGNSVSRTAYATVRVRSGDDRAIADQIRRVVRDIDPSLPVGAARSLDDVLGLAQSRPRFLAMILTVFSTLALALAAFGIYGVISYSVTQRTAEFGIRMALGAQTGDVLRMVVREGAILVAVGVVIGAAGAFALVRSLDGLLFEVNRFDAGTFAGMALVLGLVALVASWVPARRATGVDPIKALRYE